MPEASDAHTDLLPVLRIATHADLLAIANSLNRAFDVRIKRDALFIEHEADLTRCPELIADYLCRAGGSLLANRARGGGPPYAEVVQDCCAVLKVPDVQEEMGVSDKEEALLRSLLQKILDRMTEEQKQEILSEIAATTGHRATFAEIFVSKSLFRLLAPAIFTTVAQAGVAAGVTVFSSFAAVAFIGNLVFGPVGVALGSAWLAHRLTGPSYRATVPAVCQVALLRIRMSQAGA